MVDKRGCKMMKWLEKEIINYKSKISQQSKGKCFGSTTTLLFTLTVPNPLWSAQFDRTVTDCLACNCTSSSPMNNVPINFTPADIPARTLPHTLTFTVVPRHQMCYSTGTGTVNRETFKCNSRYNWKTRHFIHNRQYPSKQTSEQDFDFFFQQQSVSDLVSCYAYTQVAEAHLSAVFFLRLIPVFSPCGSNAQPSPLCISCQGFCAGLRLLTWNM